MLYVSVCLCACCHVKVCRLFSSYHFISKAQQLTRTDETICMYVCMYVCISPSLQSPLPVQYTRIIQCSYLSWTE